MSETTDVVERWRTFYLERYGEEIRALVEEYPDERSLYVDVLDLHDYDPGFTRAFFSDPDRFLRRGAAVLGDAHEAFDRVNLRVENNPGLLGLRNLRSRHVGELVTVEGVVTGIDQIRARATETVYGCPGCGRSIRTHPDGIRFSPPTSCPECESCGPFRLRHGRSTFVDTQRVRLAEVSEGLLGGVDDRWKIDIYLDDDLVDTVEKSSQLLVTGVVRLEGGSTNCFDLYLDGISTAEEVAELGEESAADALRSFIQSRWEIETGG